MICIVNTSYAQEAIVLRSSNFGELHEISFIDSVCYFHAEGLPAELNALTSTKDWDTLRHTDFQKANPPKGWKGSGWFGLWVKADTSLVGRKMSFRINHDGASEIFLDGKPIGGYGKPGHSAQETEAIRAPKDLIPLWFSDGRPHLIAIHYANFVCVYPDFLGFEVLIGDYEPLARKINHSNRLFAFILMFAAAQAILSLLHFLLFLFYPRQKLNLLYAVFVLLIGINGFGIYLFYQTRFPSIQFFADFLTSECKVLILWSGVLLLYVLNYGRIPRRRTLALSTVSLFYLVAYVLKFMFFLVYTYNDYFSVVFLICIVDGFWSAFNVMKRRQKGVWLVGIGVIAVILVYFLAWADVFHLWPYQYNSMRLFVMSAGQLLLPLCLSIYLAVNFARTNQGLSAKLAEVENLSAQALAQETEKREMIAGEAKRLDKLVQQRTAELKAQTDKLQEMDTVKSRFFTNITHEFKTPLTLIINPAKELLLNAGEATVQKQLALVLDNANRLLQLINQLLDISKMENRLMEVTRAPMDLTALISMHLLSFEFLAKQKGIAISFKTAGNLFWISGDREKLDKIILNILSNAIKFTDKGTINISLQKDTEVPDDVFILSVRDTGKGIPAAKLPYIFTRFYQADPSDTRSAEGTGIGLAITKELVELLGGDIWAESVEQRFTEIFIRMPYQAAEPTEEPALILAAADALTPIAYTKERIVADDEKPLILLIEDNEALRNFIYHTLADQYRILTAADGREGIAMALENIPSLIITDLMMPTTDGYQVSTTLKKDQKTSHVPIIILTAKSGTDNRILGIETGADAYLEKPFNKQELFTLMKNLISVRNHLHEHYSRGEGWLNENLSMPPIEKNFITCVRTAVESHLDEEGYSADQLARDMGLSRTQLHRKLKGLIGQAPGELIRIIRLEYAHDLLRRQVATVSEVAYMIGFSSPASFSTSFSRHFGFPPKKAGEQ